MSQQILMALVAFAFVTSVTPGPNNVMLMASGANFGLRRTLPHMLGVALGFGAMVALLGLGVDRLIAGSPRLAEAMKWISMGYMLWLAWKIAHAGAPGEGRVKPQPMSFWQAAAFQWVNPKAWAMALGAVAAYVPEPSVTGYALVAGVFALVNLPSVSVWAGAGQAVRRWLEAPGRLALFNWTMAGLLVLSLWPVVTLEM